MSVLKLLNRIDTHNEAELSAENEKTDGTHSLSSTDAFESMRFDPLTEFTCILSALAHDVAHPGVGNSVLARENVAEFRRYKKSIAEQNSVVKVWELLISSSYRNFLCSIVGNQSELAYFRQLFVNTVMATDVMDKDLGLLRKARWERAFAPTTLQEENIEVGAIETGQLSRNLKATVVIEHLIQARYV